MDPARPFALSRREVNLALVGLVLGMLNAALDQTMVVVALPAIASELGNIDQLPMVVAAYLITTTISMPIYGKLGDLFGRRVVFQVALAIFLAASVLSGASQDMAQLIAFRAVQGIGAGGLMTLAVTVLGDILPARERGRYMGYFMAAMMLGVAAGPILGGLIVDTVSWRWIFFGKLPLGVAAFAVIYRMLRLPVPISRGRVDIGGATLLVGATGCVLAVALWGGTAVPWVSPTMALLGTSALVLAFAFVWWERRAEDALLPLSLFRHPDVGVCVAVSFLMGVTLFGAFVFLPLLLQAVLGASATASGFLLLPLMAGIMLMSLIAGNLVTRTGRYRVWPVVGTGSVCAAVALLVTMREAGGTLGVLAPIALLGAGVGMTIPVLNLAAQNAVPHRDLGVVTSTVTFARTLGGALGVSMFGAIQTERFRVELERLVPVGVNTDVGRAAGTSEELQALEPAVAEAVVEALSRSIATVFLATLPFVLLAFVVSWWLRNTPLSEDHEVLLPIEERPAEA